MPLTSEQLQRIIAIDNKVNQALLENKDDVKIMAEFIRELADTIEFSVKIARSLPLNELSDYCFQYTGFFLFLRIVDKILGRFVSGEISLQGLQERIERIENNRKHI
jgi:hypothetical protein